MKSVYKPVSFFNVIQQEEKQKDTVEIKQENETSHINTFEPSVFGPHFWFTLHNGACKYPVDANDFYISRMKGFILGIPIMIPCEKCKVHAYEYIESRSHLLDSVCKYRKTLKEFFIDFHNYVNAKLGKPIMSYEDVNKIYKE